MKSPRPIRMLSSTRFRTRRTGTVAGAGAGVGEGEGAGEGAGGAGAGPRGATAEVDTRAVGRKGTAADSVTGPGARRTGSSRGADS